MAGMHLILSSQLSFASFHLQAIFFPLASIAILLKMKAG
jgi:hypothetical protein